MKITKSNSKTKYILIASVAILLIIGIAILCVLYIYNDQKPSIKPNSKPTQQQVKEGQNTAEQNRSSADVPPSTNNNLQSIPVTITSANQTGGILQVRTLIETTSEDGICQLTLSRNGEDSIEQTVKTQIVSSNTTCMGFNIDTTNLSRGTWKIVVNFTTNSRNMAGQAEKEVELN